MNKTTKDFCRLGNSFRISKKAESLKSGLIVILLVMGVIAFGLGTEQKPALIPEEGEMFAPTVGRAEDVM